MDSRMWRTLCARVLLALFWIGVTAPRVAHSQPAGRASGIRVAAAPPRADAALGSLPVGFEAWLHHRLASSGLRVERLEATAEGDPGPMLRAATERGAAYAVLPWLQLDGSELDLRLLLYKPGSQRLLAVVRDTAPLAELGRACEGAVVRLLAELGLPRDSGSGPAPPLLDELATSGRALVHWRAGRLHAAWQEVKGKLTPTAMRLRDAIAEEARRSDAPVLERARLLTASGEPLAAWALIGGEARAELDATRPRPALLLTAGETQLALDDPREARRYLEAALRVDPGLADAHLALGRVLARQGADGDALRALARAAELEPQDPEALLLQAELVVDPPRRAHLLLAAGRRASARLSPHRAERYYRQALEIDPAKAGEVWRARGELEEEIGRLGEARSNYGKAAELGIADVPLFSAVGRVERALGADDRAEAAFERALALEPDYAPALRELGALYTESGRTAEALPLLRRAVSLAPSDAAAAGTRRSLASALRASGDGAGALEVLAENPTEGVEAAASLRDMAAIHRDQSRPAEARDVLLRAIEISPLDPALHAELAAVHDAGSDGAAAARERELAALLGGSDAELGTLAADGAAEPSFDALLLGFMQDASGARRRRVVQLGVREPGDWRTRLLAWTHPRVPARDAIEAALSRSMARHYDLAPSAPIENPTLRAQIDRLFAFESDRSLEADAIALVNQALETDAVFLTRVIRTAEAGEGESEELSCHAPGGLALELRMLSGRDPEVASILVGGECIPNGLEAYGAWNSRALAAYALALLLAVFPLIRGWSTVVVTISVPPRTKGFFAIRIAKKPEPAPGEKRRGRRLERVRAALRLPSRFRRTMAERRTTFRWIPARRRAYTVIVKGPLLDARGKEIIGHFLEEQKARVRRGKTAELEFDFRPRECAVQVQVFSGGVPSEGARVAVAGNASSLRYVRDGTAFLYLGKGSHSILVGAGDRVAQQLVEIHSLESAIPLCVDLADEPGLVFRDCPEAVQPYLEGDLAACADALENAGQHARAQWTRAEYHRQRGELEPAASLFEASGDFERAAELRASGSDVAGSAALYERAGDFAQAADSYRAAGDLAAAIRCHEAAYEYEEALECCRELGDDAKELYLLEKTGAYLDAARAAYAAGDAERAAHNLEQIGRRDPAFCDARSLLADVLCGQGRHELAAEMLEEAVEAAGGEGAPPSLRARYGRALDDAGRRREALQMYRALPAQERAQPELARRIEALQREVDEEGSAPTQLRGLPAKESRYELLEELGRGGMGLVFKARDRHLGRLVALKRLPENLRDHPGAVRLFQSEARAAAALNHRNIVTIYDAGEEDGSYFITMELLEGRPVNAILAARRRLGAKDVARLGVQIAAGLQYAHERRIVHRDIKSANLFFTSDRVLKIMDFGLAKTIEEVRRNSTIIGGTPFFMAPEQAVGGAVDARTDLYSLGVTFYQLLTGEVPFRDGDIAYHHRHTPPPDPRSAVPDLPEALALLVLRLMAKEPDQRCSSAAEVGALLQALLVES